jgi:hypothetical protein
MPSTTRKTPTAADTIAKIAGPARPVPRDPSGQTGVLRPPRDAGRSTRRSGRRWPSRGPPHPIKKAAALRRALAVASNKMNTRIVLGDTLASRPSSAIVISRPTGCPSLRAGASLPAGASRTWGCYEERYRLTGRLACSLATGPVLPAVGNAPVFHRPPLRTPLSSPGKGGDPRSTPLCMRCPSPRR